jgi:hypothetical protein
MILTANRLILVTEAQCIFCEGGLDLYTLFRQNLTLKGRASLQDYKYGRQTCARVIQCGTFDLASYYTAYVLEDF